MRESGSCEPLFFISECTSPVARAAQTSLVLVSAFRSVPAATIANDWRYSSGCQMEKQMRKTLAILATAATIGATTLAAPAEARGIGPGLAFGLAAGAVAAGALGAYDYYGPGYGYYGYGPYYRPAYVAPGYAYYGGPYWRHRYWRPYW